MQQKKTKKKTQEQLQQQQQKPRKFHTCFIKLWKHFWKLGTLLVLLAHIIWLACFHSSGLLHIFFDVTNMCLLV